MAKTSGSTRVGRGREGAGDGNYRGSIKNVESLKNITDPTAYREMKSAISRFHSVLGVKTQNIKLADLDGAYGAYAPGTNTIYLNKRNFKNATAKQIADEKRLAYKTGWSTKTNKPVAHTVTHELAHATWNTSKKTPNAVAAKNEVRKVYNTWRKDSSKKGYGQYSKTNINEFFAETVTKAVHGRSDIYTTSLKNIIKDYNL